MEGSAFVWHCCSYHACSVSTYCLHLSRRIGQIVGIFNIVYILYNLGVHVRQGSTTIWSNQDYSVMYITYLSCSWYIPSSSVTNISVQAYPHCWERQSVWQVPYSFDKPAWEAPGHHVHHSTAWSARGTAQIGPMDWWIHWSARVHTFMH